MALRCETSRAREQQVSLVFNSKLTSASSCLWLTLAALIDFKSFLMLFLSVAAADASSFVRRFRAPTLSCRSPIKAHPSRFQFGTLREKRFSISDDARRRQGGSAFVRAGLHFLKLIFGVASRVGLNNLHAEGRPHRSTKNRCLVEWLT